MILISEQRSIDLLFEHVYFTVLFMVIDYQDSSFMHGKVTRVTRIILFNNYWFLFILK